MSASGVFLYYSLLYPLRQKSLTQPSTHQFDKTIWPMHPLISAWFSMGAGDPNAGLHAGTSTFLALASPQPLFIYLEELGA